MRKLKLPKVPVTAWQPILLCALLVAGLGSLLWLNLGSLTGGYSGTEAQTLQASSGWRHIFEHPVNAPFTIVTRLLLYLQEHSLFATRLVASLFGLATLVAFYLLVRLWHGQRTALLGAILFGTSAWFLHTARLGTPDVLLFTLLILVGGMVWHKHTNSSLALLVCFGAGALLLYVPGMVWLIAAGVLWQWRTIDRMFRKHLWVVSVGALLLVAILAPLGLAMYHDHSVAKVILGLPAQGWPVLPDVLHNLANVPLSLVLKTPANPEHWLATVPVLDYFAMAMVVLGGFVYIKHVKLSRALLVALCLLLGTVLVSLGGAVSLTIIIPFIYILVAAGTGFLLERWETVFPRNRIAQITGLVLVSLAVLASIGYSVRHYFVAWPQATQTTQVFTVQPPAPSVTMK